MTKEIYVSTDLDDRENLPAKGYAELQERRIRPAEEVFEDIRERYGV